MKENDSTSGEKNTWFNTSYEAWEVNDTPDIWEKLDESIALESIWEKLETTSIPLAEKEQDAWISEAHESWQPELPTTDGWAKLDESLSIENVWNGLNETLKQPILAHSSIWKGIAATIIGILLLGSLNDGAIDSQFNNEQEGSTAFVPEESDVVEKNKLNVSKPTPSNTIQSENIKLSSVNNSAINLASITKSANTLTSSTPSVPVENRIFDSITNQSIEPESISTTLIESILLLTPNQREQFTTDESLDLLSRKEILVNEKALLPLAKYIPKTPFHHWTVQIGTQASLLEERERSLLTTNMPRFGLAADLSYRHRIGAFQLIHAAGFSQYAQDAGKYINGRYSNTQQRLNSLQLTNSLGYNFGRTTVYGGVIFSKLLSGLEEKQNKITKVYDNSTIDWGFTGGLDMRIISFPKSGKHISIGAQYQFIRNFNSPKRTFNHLQAARLQLKFSF